MVIVGRSKKSLRPVRKAGQANGFNGNGMLFNGNGLNGNGNVMNGNNTHRDEFYNEIDTVNNSSGLEILVGTDDIDGDGIPDENVVFVSQTGVPEEEAAQVLFRAPVVPQAAPEPVEEVCEFPAQSINLHRDVIITNSTPRIESADTDVCGNLVRYREVMTRTMTAGPWVPESTTGVLSDLNISANGEVELARFGPGADIANSAGFNDIDFPYQNVGTPSFGSRYPGQGVAAGRMVGGRRKLHSSNANAGYGLAAMRNYRRG